MQFASYQQTHPLAQQNTFAALGTSSLFAARARLSRPAIWMLSRPGGGLQARLWAAQPMMAMRTASSSLEKVQMKGSLLLVYSRFCLRFLGESSSDSGVQKEGDLASIDAQFKALYCSCCYLYHALSCEVFLRPSGTCTYT